MPSDDPPILSNRRIALDPFYYRVQQGLIANRLGKKVDRSGLHRLHRHRDIAVAGEEDDRFDYAGRGQISLQIQPRSEEHTSELQSLMRISYAVFCLKKKTKKSTK